MRWLIVCLLLGCGGVPISPENEILSDFMSIANVHREPTHNAAGDIVGRQYLSRCRQYGTSTDYQPFYHDLGNCGLLTAKK